MAQQNKSESQDIPKRNPITSDLTGQKFGKLRVSSFAGYSQNKYKQALWNCTCDCDKNVVVYALNLKRGTSQSCGCSTLKSITKHGMYKTKEYKTWRQIKSRCCYEGNPSYDKYQANGVEMAEVFKEDFLAFFNDIGPVPDNEGYWSVDRIDCNKGYIPGNIRWATFEEQQRNKKISDKNTSGITGVYWRVVNGKVLSAIAAWHEIDNGVNKVKRKYFTLRKYGKDTAFLLACEYRKQQIERLNSMGYGYSENHGK
jgi:AP2 domain